MGILQDLIDLQARIGEQLESAKGAIRKWVASEQGQDILRGLDFVMVSSHMGDWCEHVGWYLPLHPTLFRYGLERQKFHVPFDAREAARLVGPSSEHWEWIADGVLRSPSIESRKVVVHDGILCMEQGYWHAAVSTLLPVLEGVISDRSGVLGGIGVGPRLNRILHREVGVPLALSAIPALRVLEAEVFQAQPFEGVAIGHTALNRHLILHGRTVGFGTEISACRVLMILVALVELLDGPLLLRSTAAMSDPYAVLDEFGPLAEIRMGGVRGQANGNSEAGLWAARDEPCQAAALPGTGDSTA